jgi:hypothetical protein
LQGVCELAQELKGAISKVNPDVARVANVVEHVAHRVEASFFITKLVDIAHTQQGLEIGEGDCWWGWLVLANTVKQEAMRLTPPSTMAIATTGAEEGVFEGQRSCLRPVDGVRVDILCRDDSAALTLAH